MSPTSDPQGPTADRWDVATVVAEFEVVDREQSVALADLLFGVDDVLTVRVGGAGERTVYRVDVPRGADDARALGARPGRDAARRLGVGLRFVRIGISGDGLGDPEGDPPGAADVPWARRPRHVQKTGRRVRAGTRSGDA